ncbi:hypothetical protein SVIO_100010 [Streptomyces violaceusniger]|uniref:Uncharacterized protein n=1 Tax=Streptomyces violaceusniger TaxID=68280 RepID=A0A4D4LLR2_STRVO|nr:hypothetical protein SVIO_100010 [Streptomyces violaceusniger]
MQHFVGSEHIEEVEAVEQDDLGEHENVPSHAATASPSGPVPTLGEGGNGSQWQE